MTSFALVKKDMLDRGATSVLMVSMVTLLILVTIVRGVVAVVILITMSMEVVTP